MKKVLFLMFLLFLIGLGTADVNAQVRIGGNVAPNASALLDLNATDATNNGTKGLALPRVNLTSPTMLLSGVTSNLTGMMVYNTTTTLGAVGIYFWNGATWVRASLPSTSMADSGKVLVSNGTTWLPSFTWQGTYATSDTLRPRVLGPVSWQKILDTSVSLQMAPNRVSRIYSPGLQTGDLCYASTLSSYVISQWSSYLYIINLRGSNDTAPRPIRCYRPSF